MSADVFTLPNFSEPALYHRGTISPIVRSVSFELANLTGAAGSAADPLETSDVIKLFKLPPDVEILGGRFDCEDLESSTGALDLNVVVTNGTTSKFLFEALTTAPRAGGVATTEDLGSVEGVFSAFDANSAIGFVTDNDNYYVAITVDAGATAAGSGDGIRVVVYYKAALESNQAAFRT